MNKSGFIALFLLCVSAFVPAFAEPNLPRAVTDNDYRKATPSQIRLGQLLFYDRVLSGTYRVSCATCHHHDRASSNGFMLDGKEPEEGDDLAINGLPIYEALKPSARHAPALFNLGAREFTHLFSDGRVEEVRGKFLSPSKELPDGMRDVLAVQSLFPAVTEDELVGTVANDVADLAHKGNLAIWNELARRVADLPEYLPLFQAAYPTIKDSNDISIVEIGNAISAFVGAEWRSDNSPFDRYLRGNDNALDAKQKRGMELFYGEAGCSSCHSGPFQTDHGYHVVGMPPWRFDSVLDDNVTAHFDDRLGRYNVTNEARDLYAFRTPSLRNVAKTAPFGYSGSYETLKDAIIHHTAPRAGLKSFVRKHSGQSGWVTKLQKSHLKRLLNTLEKSDRAVDAGAVEDLVAFLESLTDLDGLKGKLGKPVEVPSSLALD